MDPEPEKSSLGKTMWTHAAKEHLCAAIRSMDFGQCCESGMFIPDPGSRVKKKFRIRIKEFQYF
jgi:hypothetical protein